MTHNFDFRKKVLNNLETCATTAKMATYGLTISDTELVLVVLANIDNTTAHDCGREFRLAMTAICKLFGHQYFHTAASLKTTMKELSAVDGVCDMRQAP